MMDSLINFIVTHPFICWAVLFCALACGKCFNSSGRRRRIVKNLRNDQKIAFNSGFRWRPIRLKAIPNLDRAFYEKASTELAGLGFRSVGDFEYLHLTEAYPNMRTAVRQFVCDHGQIYAGACHMSIRGWMGWKSLLIYGTREVYTIAFETALNDGRFIVSTNGGNTPELSSPAQLVKQVYPKDIEIDDLLDRHIANVNRALSGHQSVTPFVVTTLDEMMELQERQHELASRHRDEVGVFSDNELQNIRPDLSTNERQALVAEAQRSWQG